MENLFKLRALKTNQNDDKSSQASTNSSTKEVTTQSEPKSATETCDISDAAAVKPPPVVRHNSGDAGIGDHLINPIIIRIFFQYHLCYCESKCFCSPICFKKPPK